MIFFSKITLLSNIISLIILGYYMISSAQHIKDISYISLLMCVFAMNIYVIWNSVFSKIHRLEKVLRILKVEKEIKDLKKD